MREMIILTSVQYFIYYTFMFSIVLLGCFLLLFIFYRRRKKLELRLTPPSPIEQTSGKMMEDFWKYILRSTSLRIIYIELPFW
jgi:hypothetical protein